MKKYLSGLFAIAVAIAFSAFTSLKSVNKSPAKNSLFWYPVDPNTNLITDVYTFFDSKANVIAADPCCDDLLQPICYFGVFNSNIPPGTNVGFPDAAHRILQRNQ